MSKDTFFHLNKNTSLTENAIADWKILIVDDIVDNLDLLSTVFELRGAKAFGAMSGEEALELATDHTFDLIVLDLAMPHMDGYQLKQVLDETPSICHIPVVAISAHQSSMEKDKAKAAGFIGLIAKPFSINRIFAEIASMLEASQA